MNSDLNRRLSGLLGYLAGTRPMPRFKPPEPEVLSVPVNGGVRVLRWMHVAPELNAERDAEIARLEDESPDAVVIVIRPVECDCPVCVAYLAAEDDGYWAARGGRPESRPPPPEPILPKPLQAQPAPARATQSVSEAQELNPEPHASPAPSSGPVPAPECARCKRWGRLCPECAADWQAYGPTGTPPPRPPPVSITLNDLLEDPG